MGSKYGTEPKHWNRFFLWAWGAWALTTLIFFGILEWFGMRQPADDKPPLTFVIRRYVPAWLFFASLFGLGGWLIQHFLFTWLT